jgi:hypothetical protein
MSNEADLFAPPSKEELMLAVNTPQPKPGNEASDPLFAPPSADELKAAAKPADDGAWAAAGSGLAHGLTFQLYDKLKAAAQAAYDTSGKAIDASGLSSVLPTPAGGEFGSQYDKRLAEQKAAVDQLREQHPYAYHGAEIGGAIANPLNTLIPGSGLLAGGRVASAFGEGIAGLAGNMIGGAGVGAIQGAGESNAHPLQNPDQAGQFGSDVLQGAKYGALGGAVGSAIGAIPAVAKKGASFLLGANPEAVERYLANPEAVKSAPDLVQSVENVKNKIGALKSQVLDESQASRNILNKTTVPLAAGVEGPAPLRQYTGADAANFYASKINDIYDKSQGVLNPEQQATVNQLKKYMQPFLESENAAFSGSRLKDDIQMLDRNTKYSAQPGTFDAPDNAVLKNVRGQLNDELRTASPEYAKVMDELRQKKAIVDQAQGLFKSDQGLANTLDRIRRERAPFAADALNNLDQQFGTNTIEQLKDALARESFEKGAGGPGGSRNVQLYSHTFGDLADKMHIPFGKAVGALTGAAVDKVGPGIARTGIDAYLGAKNFTMNPTVQSYLQALQKGAAATQASPNIDPAISQYLINKYIGNN